MRYHALSKLGVGSALLAGVLLGGCAGEVQPSLSSTNTDSSASEEQSDKADIQADISLRNLVEHSSGAYRMASAGVPSAGDFELLFSPVDDPDNVVHIERVENAPFGEAGLRIPAEIQGEYLLSAWIYGNDGSVYSTSDLVRGPDGELLYPEAQRPTIDMRLGTITDLIFVFFENIDLEEGEVSLNTQVNLDLQLSEQQREMVAGMIDPQAVGTLSGCLAYGMTQSQTLGYDDVEGLFSWRDNSGAVVLVGEDCVYDVVINDDGSPRLRGSSEFAGPLGDGSVHHFDMDLRVVDAYIDASFDVRGVTADATMELSDELATYLDESQWQHGVRYELVADNGFSEVLVAPLTRTGNTLQGTLVPIDQANPGHTVTLRILDGDAPILESMTFIDFLQAGAINFSLAYELNILINAQNLTNVHFNAWLADNTEATSGVQVAVDLLNEDGLPLYAECDTGSLAAYSCLIAIPTGSVGSVTYSHEGYTSVTQDLLVDTLESINLTYVSLEPASETDAGSDGSGGGVTTETGNSARMVR